MCHGTVTWALGALGQCRLRSSQCPGLNSAWVAMSLQYGEGARLDPSPQFCSALGQALVPAEKLCPVSICSMGTLEGGDGELKSSGVGQRAEADVQGVATPRGHWDGPQNGRWLGRAPSEAGREPPDPPEELTVPSGGRELMLAPLGTETH